MIRLQRKPVVLNGLRNTGAEALYKGFRPHIAGPISFMQQQDALEMQSACRQQVCLLAIHSCPLCLSTGREPVHLPAHPLPFAELEAQAGAGPLDQSTAFHKNPVTRYTS